jgi:hypothetical protein
LAQTSAFDAPSIRSIIALWRAPERLMNSRPCPGKIVDVAVFGETGVIVCPRSAVGAPGLTATIPGAVEMARSLAGTLMLRGAMVPRAAFPPGAEHGAAAHLMIAADGFVDTGYPCRLPASDCGLIITGPPAGTNTVGGYRFHRDALDRIAAAVSPDAVVMALPHALLGERLAGRAATSTAPSLGGEVNALVADAFHAGNRHVGSTLTRR